MLMHFGNFLCSLGGKGLFKTNAALWSVALHASSFLSIQVDGGLAILAEDGPALVHIGGGGDFLAAAVAVEGDLLLAAGGQRQNHNDQQQDGNDLFHIDFSLVLKM